MSIVIYKKNKVNYKKFSLLPKLKWMILDFVDRLHTPANSLTPPTSVETNYFFTEN